MKTDIKLLRVALALSAAHHSLCLAFYTALFPADGGG